MKWRTAHTCVHSVVHNTAQSSSYNISALLPDNHHSSDAVYQWRQREFEVGGDEPCEPTLRLPDWSELAASYSRMKSAWGWVNGGQPILVCYIRKYVIILGAIPVDVPPTKILGDVSPASPAELTPVLSMGEEGERPVYNYMCVKLDMQDFTTIENESVPKIILNDTIIFFLNCNQHFGNFKP